MRSTGFRRYLRSHWDPDRPPGAKVKRETADLLGLLRFLTETSARTHDSKEAVASFLLDHGVLGYEARFRKGFEEYEMTKNGEKSEATTKGEVDEMDEMDEALEAFCSLLDRKLTPGFGGKLL